MPPKRGAEMTDTPGDRRGLVQRTHGDGNPNPTSPSHEPQTRLEPTRRAHSQRLASGETHLTSPAPSEMTTQEHRWEW